MKTALRVLALILGLAAIFYFKNKLSQDDALSPLLPPESFVAQTTTTLSGTVTPGGVTINAPPSAGAPVDTFAVSLKTCTDNRVAASSPKDLVQQLERELKTKENVVENWHVVTPDGHEERIMLITSDRENANGRKEVRWFDVDKEGLPVPKKIAAADSLDPKPEFLESLKSRGQMKFHQTKDLLRMNDGTSANVETVNGEIRDLQIYFGAHTLSCRALDCQCK